MRSTTLFMAFAVLGVSTSWAAPIVTAATPSTVAPTTATGPGLHGKIVQDSCSNAKNAAGHGTIEARYKCRVALCEKISDAAAKALCLTTAENRKTRQEKRRAKKAAKVTAPATSSIKARSFDNELFARNAKPSATAPEAASASVGDGAASETGKSSGAAPKTRKQRKWNPCGGLKGLERTQCITKQREAHKARKAAKAAAATPVSKRALYDFYLNELD
ncbi:hypothetical protein C8J56DRAFT_586434 [Mycena floridula]|nr:hypothetical protein C8J56DRAFT_586434 [Mycena floridula]